MSSEILAKRGLSNPTGSVLGNAAVGVIMTATGVYSAVAWWNRGTGEEAEFPFNYENGPSFVFAESMITTVGGINILVNGAWVPLVADLAEFKKKSIEWLDKSKVDSHLASAVAFSGIPYVAGAGLSWTSAAYGVAAATLGMGYIWGTERGWKGFAPEKASVAVGAAAAAAAAYVPNVPVFTPPPPLVAPHYMIPKEHPLHIDFPFASRAAFDKTFIFHSVGGAFAGNLVDPEYISCRRDLIRKEGEEMRNIVRGLDPGYFKEGYRPDDEDAGANFAQLMQDMMNLKFGIGSKTPLNDEQKAFRKELLGTQGNFFHPDVGVYMGGVEVTAILHECYKSVRAENKKAKEKERKEREQQTATPPPRTRLGGGTSAFIT